MLANSDNGTLRARLHLFLLSCSYSTPYLINFRNRSKDEKLRKRIAVVMLPLGIMRWLKLSFTYKIGGTDHGNGSAVVAIMKNEESYVSEWIKYYKAIGCDVIIYCNDSEGNLVEIAKQNGAIVHEIHGSRRQNDAYNDALIKYRRIYKYIMFFDGDEFLASTKLLNDTSNRKAINVTELLNGYFNRKKDIAGLGINWLIFGSSGHRTMPLGRVTECYTHCANDEYEWNQLVKSVVMPTRVLGFAFPHLPTTLLGYHIYDLDGNRIKGPRIKLPENREIRLHHYFTKSFEEFSKRISRGMADRNAKRSINEFYERDQNDVVNTLANQIYKSRVDR